MSRLIKINGQLVRFEELSNRANDYKDKRWRYTKSGDVEEVTNETELDDDIVFSGSKSNLRRIADLERNVSVLATKIVTASDTAGFEDGVDDNFGNLFDEDVRIKGDLFRISSNLVYIDSGVDLDFNGNKLTQIGTPTLTDDAATKGYVDTAVASLVDSAPTTLDTLNELAAALGDDADFATTVTNSLANKADTSAIPADVSDLTDNNSLLGGGFSGSYNDLTDVPFDVNADISKIRYSTTTPSISVPGEFWYNPSNGKIYQSITDPNTSRVVNNLVASKPSQINFYSDRATIQRSYSSGFAGAYITFNSPIQLYSFNAGSSGRTVLKSITYEDGTSFDFTNFPTIDGGTSNGVMYYSGSAFNDKKVTTVVLHVDADNNNTQTFDLIATGFPLWQEIDTGSFSGDYNDLDNKPILFDGQYSSLAGAPSIPADVSDLTDNSGLLGGGFSGSYNDLTDTPTLFSGSYNDLTDVPFEIDSDIPELNFSTTQPPALKYLGQYWYELSTSKLYKSVIDPGTRHIHPDDATVSNMGFGYNLSLGRYTLNWGSRASSGVITFVSPVFVESFVGKEGINSGSEEGVALRFIEYEDGTRYYPHNESGYDQEGNQAWSYSGPGFNQKVKKLFLVATPIAPFSFPLEIILADTHKWQEIDPGYATQASITSSDLDMGTNKILYSNVYSTLADLPSATDYHGMFAHVHSEGKAYFAHAGAWVPLTSESYVNTAISNLVNGADAAFDTLKEIADAMATDTELSTAISNLTIPSVLTDLSITDGTAGQVLTTDGAGGFTFADAVGGGASVEVSATAPSSPETGDLWFDSGSTGELYVYNGSAWITTADGSGGGSSSSGGGASIELSDTAPLSPTAGALWFKTDTLNLYVYYSSNWVEIGDGGSGGTTAAESPWTSATSATSLYTGQKVLADTSLSAVTLTLPSSPSLGDEVRIIDASGNAATNNITVARNGSNIMGLAEDFVININEAAFGLVYFNATRGWVLTEK